MKRRHALPKTIIRIVVMIAAVIFIEHEDEHDERH